MQSILFLARRVHAYPRNRVCCTKLRAWPTYLANHGDRCYSLLWITQCTPFINIYGYRQEAKGAQQLYMSDVLNIHEIKTARASSQGKVVTRGQCLVSPMSTLMGPIQRNEHPLLLAWGTKRGVSHSIHDQFARKLSLQHSTQTQTHMSRRRKKRLRPSPPASLASWLDEKSDAKRALIWKKVDAAQNAQDLSLPIILLRYLHETKLSGLHQDPAGKTFDAPTMDFLSKRGYIMEDVRLWATITTAQTTEEVAKLFLSSKPVQLPTFLLLEVLRRPGLTVRSFRSLLVHAWEHALGIQSKDHLSLADGEVNDRKIVHLEPPIPPMSPRLVGQVHEMQESTFTVLVSRLLRQCRQLWAPAVISISHMTIAYCEGLAGERCSPRKALNPTVHARICKIYNFLLRRLSLPAAVNPMKSMTYNWHSQRLLLRSAEDFVPSIQLDQSSYRAVASVLGSSKKSPLEEKYTKLVQRSWPPWRKEQDGMDVERPPEEDASRATLAISRMNEAGYEDELVDRAIRILGGRESDGTPTVQTRSLIKVRRKSGRNPGERLKIRGNTDEWAARITATRDIREAWAAFLGFTDSGHRATHAMYYAMFEKLIFHYERGHQYRNYDALPGDGKEVLPVLDDNISESERIRTQPPSIDELYFQMVKDGIKPSGRFLHSLIVQAPNVEAFVRYLHDGALNPVGVANLLSPPGQMDASSIKRIPDQSFYAIIKFLSWTRPSDAPQALVRRPVQGLKRSGWTLSHISTNPLLHAFELMKCRQCSSRPAWYALFSALAWRRVVFDDRVSQHSNDIMAWRLLEAALRDFQKIGIQLDPDGLGYLCRGLEKALLSSQHVSKDQAAPVHTGPLVVKEAFAMLTESSAATYGLPRLLFNINGSHLHAYIRILGLNQDIDEVMSVLRWMVEHQDELEDIAGQARNGGELLRRVLIAIRAFFDHGEETDVGILSNLEALMAQLQGWGGWPSDDEVDTYLEHSRGDTVE